MPRNISAFRRLYEAAQAQGGFFTARQAREAGYGDNVHPYQVKSGNWVREARGVSKETLRLDAWLKDVGASTELRQWFRHNPDKWPSFRTRYFRELDSRPEAWRPIVSAARRGTVTLVYSSRDTEHNNAVALKDYLQSKIRRQPGSR